MLARVESQVVSAILASGSQSPELVAEVLLNDEELESCDAWAKRTTAHSGDPQILFHPLWSGFGRDVLSPLELPAEYHAIARTACRADHFLLGYLKGRNHVLVAGTQGTPGSVGQA